MKPVFSSEAEQHAFLWLAVGNAAGLLMSFLLLAPSFGEALAPLTYGRWAAVHIDTQIYGFCSLPLLALLLRAYSPPGGPGRLGAWAIRGWSGAIAFLAVSLLTGHSSGKVFAEWTGAARWVFAGALALASAAVLAAFRDRLRFLSSSGRPETGLALRARLVGILVLLPAPLAMVWAPAPGVYPPIDRAGGGATGANTLASVLGVGLVLALSPFLAGLRPRDGGHFARRVLAGLAAHFLLVLASGPGDHANGEPLQVAALLSSLIWLPLLWRHLALFPWPRFLRRWVAAMAGWSLVLAATGLLAGLPGMAERIKYTHFLVGHVHAAAAGFLTAWLFVLLGLAAQARGSEGGGPAGDATAFFAWQGGTLLHVASLLVLGWQEGAAAELLWSGAPAVRLLYLLRSAGGVCMLFSSWRWLCAALVPAERPAEVNDVPRHARLLSAGRPL